MKTIFEALLNDCILAEPDKDKQLRLARAVLEGNAAIQKISILERFITSQFKPEFTWVKLNGGRMLGCEANRFPEAANDCRKKQNKYEFTFTRNPG